MSQVIELSDDDNVAEILYCQKSKHKTNKSEKIFKCLNPECRSTVELVRASSKARRFYGLEAYAKKTRICKQCLEYIESRKLSLINMVKSGKNLLDKDVSFYKKTIILSESESDKTDEDTEESEFEYDPSEIAGCKVNNKNKNNDDSSGTQMEELRSVIMGIISDMNLSQQMLEGRSITKARLEQAEKDFDLLNLEFRSIEKNLDNLRNDFYNSFLTETQFLTPLEIGASEEKMSEFYDDIIAEPFANTSIITSLPPIGILERPSLNIGEEVYVLKYTKLSKWIQAKILSLESSDKNEYFYKVKYSKDDDNSGIPKVISFKNIAYFKECSLRIPVGTRVITSVVANNQNKSFYVGIVAESPSAANKYRYLIFFDDGYVQYAFHSNIRVVVGCSQPEWEDVVTDSKEFIKNYLEAYPERPMVRLQKFNYIKMELDGKWWKAQVVDVDASLAKMYYPVLKKVEWIYRGSTRLGPLFNKKVNLRVKSEYPNKIVRKRTIPANKTGPVVEYINIGEEPSKDEHKRPESRAVAKKSTSMRANINSEMPIEQQLVMESKGIYTRRRFQPNYTKFRPHQCTNRCIDEPIEIAKSKETAPLFKPLLLGWNRQICYQKKNKITPKKLCNYMAPCGRRLRSLEEILMYLRLTKSQLEIDYFTIDPEIKLAREWVPFAKYFDVLDITDNNEDVFISCVNAIEKEGPIKFTYSSVRIPTKNVYLNLNPDYLVCCSCEDDCKDKTRCECWQLTMEAANASHQEIKHIGYEFRRLNNQVITGIYECNSRCSCQVSCLNRVVQFPVRQKLQLFKTAKRGWGVRTLSDMPKGTFICVYVGKMLTETEANEDGILDGADDYYANLDFIETVEEIKEGYESGVEDIEAETPSPKEPSEVDEVGSNVQSGRKRKSDRLEQDSDYVCSSKPKSKSNIETRPKSKNKNKIIVIEDGDESDDSTDSLNRRPKTYEPKASDFLLSKFNTKSMRDYYSVDESVYVMDAKITGNIGRYLNHSCDPNVFVQNVFVDTHDPRFPWISFFSGKNIKAGMELTWDYNYEVGSVAGKMKYCYCRSSNCRGRLL